MPPKKQFIAKEHVHFVKPKIFYMERDGHNGKGLTLIMKSKGSMASALYQMHVSKVREQYLKQRTAVTYISEKGKD